MKKKTCIVERKGKVGGFIYRVYNIHGKLKTNACMVMQQPCKDTCGETRLEVKDDTKTNATVKIAYHDTHEFTAGTLNFTSSIGCGVVDKHCQVPSSSKY